MTDKTEAQGLAAELYGEAGEIDNNDEHLTNPQDRCALSLLLIEAGKHIERLERGRDAWIESAEMFRRNEQFYHRLVSQIGDMFGQEARISDDGSVQDDVLVLKVPELVAALREQVERLEGERRDLAPSLYDPEKHGYESGSESDLCPQEAIRELRAERDAFRERLATVCGEMLVLTRERDALAAENRKLRDGKEQI